VVASLVSAWVRKKPLQPADLFVSLRTGAAASGVNGRGQTPEQQLAIFKSIFSDRLVIRN
jgi:hypothetical protein